VNEGREAKKRRRKRFVFFLSSLTEEVEDHIWKHSNAIVADYFILSSFFTTFGMLSTCQGMGFLIFFKFSMKIILNFPKKKSKVSIPSL
jgi:hypothetical protein